MRRMSRVPDRIPPGPIKLTYEDYVDLPDDGKRYEILDGELEVSPAPAPRHQGVSCSSFCKVTSRSVGLERSTTL